MRWLLWKLGIVDLVWTFDVNGDRRLRIVRGTNDRPVVCAIICGGNNGVLNPDGTVIGIFGQSVYTKRWLPYTGLFSGFAKAPNREPAT